MTIPLVSLTQYEGTDWKDYLTKISLYEIFKELIEEYVNDKETLTSYIRYITWAYSPNSPKIIQGMEWAKNKNEIFKEAEIKNTKENRKAVGVDGVFDSLIV